MNSILLYCVISFFIVSVVGTLLHFAYELSGRNRIVGLFSAVNESTWEHIKLALLPMLACAVVGHFLEFNNFYFATFISFVSVILLILGFYYGYTYFSKKSILVIDILIFYVSVFLAYLFAYLIMKQPEFNLFFEIIGKIGIFIVLCVTFLFTVYPPKCKIFLDPITNSYGYND